MRGLNNLQVSHLAKRKSIQFEEILENMKTWLTHGALDKCTCRRKWRIFLSQNLFPSFTISASHATLVIFLGKLSISFQLSAYLTFRFKSDTNDCSLIDLGRIMAAVWQVQKHDEFAIKIFSRTIISHRLTTHSSKEKTANLNCLTTDFCTLAQKINSKNFILWCCEFMTKDLWNYEMKI